jgi:hypothetical protein
MGIVLTFPLERCRDRLVDHHLEGVASGLAQMERGRRELQALIKDAENPAIARARELEKRLEAMLPPKALEKARRR